MLYQRSYSHRNKTVVLQPKKLQEAYVVPEVILPQKQNRGIIAKKTTGSLCCTRGHTSTETKTVVLQPRKPQEVYVVSEVILPQKQNCGIIAKKTTGSLCCTRGHTPTETKPWYYSQENYLARKSLVQHRLPVVFLAIIPRFCCMTSGTTQTSCSVLEVILLHRNKTVVLQPRKLQEV